METLATDPIDTRRWDFLSYAPPFGERPLGVEELRVSVEPEIGVAAGQTGLTRSCFPLRPAKIQPPILPDETLRRDRLFDWLDGHSNRRVIYVVAEAGFGKTTLVADFLRRSRLRTFWYRLDEDDTDGLVFLRYLVAACQAVDVGLLARSAALLAEPSLEPVSQEAVLGVLLSEIDCLGEVPSALVLDDFHTVESVGTVGSVAERIVARAPAGLEVIVASRRTPSLAVAALRARGELAELGRDELAFNECETGQLFRDTYHHPLEPAVLHELQLRTDGWAASLQLVKTAVDGRSPGEVRAFVDSLSGAEGDLYDYLAEEVVADLPAELRNFLVRASILEDIDPETAAIASGNTPARSRRLLSDALRQGLLSRGDDLSGTWRFHPLVREFLLTHLEAEAGEGGLAEMHRRLAAVMEPRSWRLAARHWAAAGEAGEVRRVVSAATPTIIGTGDLAAADEFVTRFPEPNLNPWFDIIRTRQLMAEGRFPEALEGARGLARLAAEGALNDSRMADAAGLTIVHVALELEEPDLWVPAVGTLKGSRDCEIASIAMALDGLYKASDDGDLNGLRLSLLEVVRVNQSTGHTRFRGISLLNLASVLRVMGEAETAVTAGAEALEILRTFGRGGDLPTAHMNLAMGKAHLGSWADAAPHISEACDSRRTAPADVYAEAAELEAMYGDPARAQQMLDRVFSEREHRPADPFCRFVAARVALAYGDITHAGDLLGQIHDVAWMPGFRASVRALDLQIRATANPSDPALPALFDTSEILVEQQHASFWGHCIRLTKALISRGDELAVHLKSLATEDFAYLSIQAELVIRRLADMDSRAMAEVHEQAVHRPERWRWALRQALTSGSLSQPGIRRAAELLEDVGEADDVHRLYAFRKKKSLRLPDAGRALHRRLAPRVYVEDLGRVSIHVGDRVIPGPKIRRKVLSLLCFLLTRPQFTATREQVLEALWPEMDPVAAANSLNQSTYFLRRILEPGCADETSAGYLSSGADLVWLDNELVNSRSADCHRLIGLIRRDQSPELVSKLAETYRGRFAVDFMYDDWAASFRDCLHASYLDRIERAIACDIASGAFDRALTTAQLALQADPDAEEIELSLLRLYRRIGANAAAAEQYAHYANVMREQLGIEPPPLEAL
jgi:ATP/maltotriose-dependent transcriptional regulator MalT/DNA-binding SARP family transcriptional activator